VHRHPFFSGWLAHHADHRVVDDLRCFGDAGGGLSQR
jgi:hypothetical protein